MFFAFQLANKDRIDESCKEIEPEMVLFNRF